MFVVLPFLARRECPMTGRSLEGGPTFRTAKLEMAAQPGGSDPTGDGPAAAGQDGPKNNRTNRSADRRSRAEASRANHWHRAGSGWEDVMASSVRGDRLAW